MMCVRNGSHFCTPVLMNMCNITFQVLRLGTFVYTSVQKKIVTIIYVVKRLKGFGWNNFGPASQTVSQHYISIGPEYRVIWCFWRRDVKRHQHNRRDSISETKPTQQSRRTSLVEYGDILILIGNFP